MRLDPEQEVRKEVAIHGAEWSSLHGGYFSDPASAAPLLEEVLRAIEVSCPGTVFDLGGGTGFLLGELAKRGFDNSLRLINIDCSGVQLGRSRGGGITTVHRSLSDFRRGEIAPGPKPCLFMMRSVLHYFGEKGLLPILKHLRGQARKGEHFIHQTACFESRREAECLNLLYRLMGTGKWYPAASALAERLESAGWEVRASLPAPTLLLEWRDLMRRYGFDRAGAARIRGKILEEFGEEEGLFEALPEGFRAYLRYRIYGCRAV